MWQEITGFLITNVWREERRYRRGINVGSGIYQTPKLRTAIRENTNLRLSGPRCKLVSVPTELLNSETTQRITEETNNYEEYVKQFPGGNMRSTSDV